MNNSNPRLFFTEIYTLKNPKPKSQKTQSAHEQYSTKTLAAKNAVKTLKSKSGDRILQHNLSKKDQAKIDENMTKKIIFLPFLF